MNCSVCAEPMTRFATAKILGKYETAYYSCPRCQFVRTEKPHWLAEAYTDALNKFDTGVLWRNSTFAQRTAAVLFFCFNRKGKFLDYAGGYGILTRLMRDAGFDFYWHDPYAKNLLAKGFEATMEKQTFDLVTCFEAAEHFMDPLQEFEKMFSVSSSILFSTTLLPQGNPPQPTEWEYYGLEHGQHISFYSRETLKYLARHFHCQVFSDGVQFHLLTRKADNAFMLPILLRWGRAFTPIVQLGMKSKTLADSRWLAQLDKAEKSS